MTTEPENIYCIPMQFENQKEPLKKHCFGDCGKISIGGAIDLGQYGLAWICHEKTCPHEKGVVGPIGTSEFDATVFIRAVEM